MTKTELKNKLLETGIFVDNEWLDRYIELVLSNQGTSYTKFKTQNHHIIPVCYYRNRSIEVDNSISNLVTLLLKDHLLAHCYLVLSSEDKQFKANMFYAICFISGLEVDDDTKVIELIDSDLSVYQEAYEQGRISAYSNNPMFDEVKKAHHDRIMRSTEVRNKISHTLKLLHQNNRKYSVKELHPYDKVSHRCSLSQSALLRCYAYKDGAVKRILKSDAQKYCDEGWHVPYIIGYGHKDTLENVVWIHKGTERKQIVESLLTDYLIQGWIQGSGVHQDSEFRKSVFTDEVRRKMSESHKGKSPANKGIPCSEEQKKKLSEHFKGSKWMNNGIIQKQVPASKIQEYVEKGFVFGFLKKVGGDANEEVS